MAQPVTIKPGKVRILLGDGASPEVFTAPCGFTDKSFSRVKSLNEVSIPDCDDPDAPIVLARDVASISWSFTGQGVLAAESVATWDAFYDSITSKNVRIEMEFPSPTGTITYTGAAHLESFEVAAAQGSRVTVNVSLQSDGELTRSPSL